MHKRHYLTMRLRDAPNAAPMGQALLLGGLLVLLGWLISTLAADGSTQVMPGAYDGPEPVVQLIDPQSMIDQVSGPPAPAGT